MSASNSGSGDSMEWGRGRSSGSRKGKRGGNNSSDKPRQPQRGLGVAQLEKIRIQSEMAEYLHHPLGQPPPIHRTGSFNLEEQRLSHSISLPSSSSPPFHSNIGVSSSYPIHRPNLAMAYGERSGDIRYGAFQTNPIIRSPNYHGAIYGSEAHYYTHPSNVTLPLFEPEESTCCLNRPYDLNQTVDSSNSDDQEALMDGSSSSDGNRGNDKRPAQSSIDKIRERKRGVGIAKLEKMIAEKAMKEALKDGSGSRNGNCGNGKRPAQSFTDKLRERKRGVGIAKLEKMREEEAMKTNISGPGINIGGIQGMISYETNGDISGLHMLPFSRPPSTSGAADNVNPNNSGASAANVSPSNTAPKTLQLFPDHMEDERADSKGDGDHNLPVEPACKNSDDPHDLDLYLKL